jgi:hypothetical protein
VLVVRKLVTIFAPIQYEGRDEDEATGTATRPVGCSTHQDETGLQLRKGFSAMVVQDALRAPTPVRTQSDTLTLERTEVGG